LPQAPLLCVETFPFALPYLTCTGISPLFGPSRFEISRYKWAPARSLHEGVAPPIHHIPAGLGAS